MIPSYIFVSFNVAIALGVEMVHKAFSIHMLASLMGRKKVILID
ncbi:hypothetical protein [Bartonella saheliensis]|nr:hypothetical protein [Bartonella saheliensis]